MNNSEEHKTDTAERQKVTTFTVIELRLYSYSLGKLSLYTSTIIDMFNVICAVNKCEIQEN